MRKIVIVKGCSGVGKSTRLSALVDKLELVHQCEPLSVEKNWGFIVANNLIIGGYNKQGKFQGLDGVFRKIGSMVDFSKTIESWSHMGYNIIVEGSALSLTYRLRPQYLVRENVFESSLCSYFLYNDKSEYEKRILDRTGKLPSKDAGWRHNQDFEREYVKYSNELLELDNVSLHTLHYCKFDQPVEDFVDLAINYLTN